MIVVGAASSRGPVAAVGGTVGAVIVLGLAARPRLVAPAVLALVPSTSGLLRGGIIPVLKVSEVVTVLGAVLLMALRPAIRRLTWTRLDSAVATFAVVSALVGAYHVEQAHGGGLTASLRVLLRPTLLFVIYRTVASGIDSDRDVRRALRWAIAATLPVSVLTLLQFVDFPGIRRLLISMVGSSTSLMPTAAQHGAVRTTGPFSIWHSLDGYLLPVVLLAAALLIGGRQQVMRTRWLVLIVLLDLGAMVTTLTFAAIIGLVLGLVLVGFAYRRTGRVVVGLVLVGAVAIALFYPAIQLRIREQFGSATAATSSSTPQTLTYRLQIWHDEFLPSIEAHPVVGFGNALPSDAAFQHTDNEYFTLLLRGGGILVAAVLVTVFGGLLSGRQLARRSRRPHELALGRAVAIAALCPLLMGIVWPYITDAGFGEIWFGLVGVVAAVLRTTPAPLLRRVPAAALAVPA